MDDAGPRLRRLRELHGLSQRQLAKRSGVSNATISQVENGQTDPSLGILKKILDAIPVSIGDFFAQELPAESRVVFRAAELTEIGRGAISYRQVGSDLGARRLQLMLERYAPGADTGRALLSHESEEAGIVLEGRLELTVGGERHLLGPGDAYLFDSRLPHRFRNAGTGELVMVSACTPPSF